MSTPKRYDDQGVWKCLHFEGSTNGWVKWDDYAALVQQGIRDHQDWRSKLNFLEADYKAEVARLRAENERLRKAGDLVAEELIGCYKGEGYDPKDSDTLPIWKAAKEGSDAK